MRHVCKQLQSAMLSGVQGYTLHLDGRAAGLREQMNLLKHTQLSHLRVTISDAHEIGEFFDG